MIGKGYHPLQDASVLPETAFTFDIPPAPAAPPLIGDQRVDIAVIGAGLTGLSAALHAAQGGARVAVLEANAIGWGASGRSFGQVVPYLRQEPKATRASLGPAEAEMLIDAAAGAPAFVFDLIRRHQIQCDARSNGVIYAAHSPAQLRKLQERGEYWGARGAPVRVLDAAAAAEAIGGGSYWGGIIDGRGGTVNPLALCRGLARAAIAAGATVHEQSRALRLQRRAGTWRVETATGVAIADTVMLCTDSYTDDLWPGLRRSMVYLRGYQLVSAPLPEDAWQGILPGNQAMTDTHRLMSGIRKHRNRRIQVSAAVGLPGPEQAADTRPAERRIATLFPSVGPISWERAWSGWIGLTVDQFPRLLELAPGLVAGYGYSGRGMALSVVMGRELARRAAGVQRAEIPFPGGATRAFPLAPLVPAAIAGLLGVYRFRDMLDDKRYGRGEFRNTLRPRRPSRGTDLPERGTTKYRDPNETFL